MDLYHSWIYERLLNTEWFMWILVSAVFVLNVLGPLIAWYFLGGKQAIAKALKSSNRKTADD